MRFNSVIIIAALPLLASFIPFTLARPVQSYSAGLDARSRRLDASSGISTRAVSDYLDLPLDARANGIPGIKYIPKEKPQKISAAARQQRKADRRTAIANSQAKNAAKKAALIALGPPPMYRTPRDAKMGYRARQRAGENPARRPKQPKTPKPNMVKGQAKTEKARVTMEKARQGIRDRKQAGRLAFGDAKEKYAKTTGLPGRKTTFTANGQTVNGKDVRTAIFNTHHFHNNEGKALRKCSRTDRKVPRETDTSRSPR